MKKKLIFFLCLAVFLVLVTFLPNQTDSNGPGAGDIWWMNVPEITEHYHTITNKN
ncbi:hypothetical protein QA612_11035 [Evansella sp. AB-P1]|uniref:hypothetical protein n=1 Tax=Evansella sp. AB-P1 TaxID=3037653 RepID=UPI00241F45F2|nr:hypothetical protein [Evansella sp. AB-P1]MDG5788024.1 hypothetical protein [Evansella sp. AB-P1]